jgi:hypothetical protein
MMAGVEPAYERCVIKTNEKVENVRYLCAITAVYVVSDINYLCGNYSWEDTVV